MIHLPNKSLTHAVAIMATANKGSSVSPLHIKADGDDTVTFRLYGHHGVEHRTKCDIETTCDFYMNFDNFSDAVKAVAGAGELVTLQLNESTVTISSGKFKTELPLTDSEHDSLYLLEGLPALATITPHHSTDTMLLDAMNKVFYASSSQEYQAMFRSILLDPQTNNSLAVVATDGFRLAREIISEASEFPYKAPVSRVYVPFVVKTFSDSEQIHITLLDRDMQPNTETPVRIAFYDNQTLLIGELLEGTFPDYERVIPADFITTLTIDADEFADTVKRVALMSDKQGNNRIDLEIKDGTIFITSDGKGKTKTEYNASHQSGDNMTLAYNAQYLIDSLAQLKGAEIEFNLSGQTSPSVMQHEDSMAMVVPLRTDK